MLVKAIFLLIVHEKDPSNLGHQHIYIYNIYTYKDANFHRKTDSIVVKRDFDETMNYILCGGLPEYPLQRCEKSWTKRIVIRITISAIILHMLSHNKSTNIDSYHVLTFQKWGDHAHSRIHVKVRDALPLGSLYKFIDR